jgi:hypothetical protein
MLRTVDIKLRPLRLRSSWIRVTRTARDAMRRESVEILKDALALPTEARAELRQASASLASQDGI